jgi:dolichol kinase
MSPTLRVILILASLGLGIGIFAKYRQIQREEDHGRLMSVIGYAGSVLAMLMLFPADLELGLTVLAILAFGDGAATFFGRFIQGRKLPWNREKTWSGFLGFLCVGTPMAAIIFWGETHNLEAQTPGVSFPTAFLYASVATFTAAVAESLPSRINDNIRVGLTAAVSLVVIHLGIVGW